MPDVRRDLAERRSEVDLLALRPDGRVGTKSTGREVTVTVPTIWLVLPIFAVMMWAWFVGCRALDRRVGPRLTGLLMRGWMRRHGYEGTREELDAEIHRLRQWKP